MAPVPEGWQQRVQHPAQTRRLLPVGSGGCRSSCHGCCQLRLCLPFSSDCFHPGLGLGEDLLEAR